MGELFRRFGVLVLGSIVASVPLFGVNTDLLPETLALPKPRTFTVQSISNTPLIPELLLPSLDPMEGQGTTLLKPVVEPGYILAIPKLQGLANTSTVTTQVSQALPSPVLSPAPVRTAPVVAPTTAPVTTPITPSSTTPTTVVASPSASRTTTTNPPRVTPSSATTQATPATTASATTQTSTASTTATVARPAGSPAARLSYVEPRTTTSAVTQATSTTQSSPVTNTALPSSSTLSRVETTPVSPALSTSLVPELASAVGQSQTITLPGQGWLYLGTGTAADGVVYLTNRLQGTDTVFSFRLEKTGVKTLNFQKQSGAAGGIEKKSVMVEVVTRAELPTAEARISQARSSATASLPGTNTRPVVSPENPALTLSPGLQNQPVSMVSTRELPTDPKSLYDLAVLDERAGRKADALTIYQSIIQGHPGFAEMAEVMYRRAALLEQQADYAALKEAFELYVGIQRDYPFSRRVEDARARARYLDRNFFGIR